MNSTGWYGAKKWQKSLMALMTAFTFVVSSAGNILLFTPNIAHAAGTLAITCDDVSINGNTWTLSGTWSATDFPGQSTQYDAAVFSPSGTSVDDSSQDAPDTFVISSGPANTTGGPQDDMNGTWSNQVVFASTPTEVFASLYHAAIPGNEQSGDATCSFTLPPQCSDGIDNDNDGNIDYPADAGCSDANDDDESDDPTPTSTLTLVKEVTNDNGGDADATQWTLQATGPTSISGVSGGGAVTAATVDAGTYDLSEANGPSGYALTGWDCGGFSMDDADTITLSGGEDVTCTATNDDMQGTLVIVKELPNDDGGAASYEDFAFQVNGGATTTFMVSGQNSISVDAGIYSVVEVESNEPLSGYDVSYDNCTNVSVALGETETCTITNDDIAPSLTVTKVVNNNYRGTKQVVDFNLFVSLSQVISGVANFFNAGNYTVSETEDSAYNAEIGGDCEADGTIMLALGETYECTITNSDKEPGTLTVIKVIENDNPEGFEGTETDPGAFTIEVTGGNPDPSSFAGSGVGVEVLIDAGAEYSVEETAGPSGYGVSYSEGCFGTMPEGGSATCTVTNNDVSPTQAFVTVIKEVINDNGGEVSAGAWSLHVTDSENNVTNVTNGAANLFDPGTYTISESGNVGGYAQTGISCTVDGGSEVPGASIAVEAGHSYVCTVTNDDIAPVLTIQKALDIQYGGTAETSDWTVGAVGATSISGAGSVTSGANFVEGKYTLTETGGPDGYTPGEWSCDNLSVDENNQINISIGQTSTCTITNYDEPGTLYVIKKVINDNGGSYDPEDFTMLVSGVDVSDEEFPGTDVEPGYMVTMDAGEYSVTESGPDGYGLTLSEDCSGTIGNGEVKTCTLTNDDGQATLTIEKYTEEADGTFTFEITNKDDAQVQTSQGFGSTEVGLNAGVYSITEVVPTGWNFDGAYCYVDGDEGTLGEEIENGIELSVGLGEEVVCEFYNEAGADISVEKSVDDASPTVGQTLLYTVTVTNNGPADASSVTVYEALPAGLTYVSDDSSGAYSTTTGAWDVGALLNGESKSLGVTVTVDEGTNGTTIVNNVTVSLEDETVFDYNEDNDQGSASVSVVSACSDGIDNDDDGLVDYGFDPSCTSPDDNDEGDDPNGGGGGGGPLGGGPLSGGGGPAGGIVLGAATTTGQVLGESCGLYMDQHLRRGNPRNSADQVEKLQEFLTQHGFGAFTPTGYFGPLTEDAVKGFQSANADHILTPWGETQPTGLVYLTTLRWINMMECPDLALQLPDLVPWNRFYGN